MPFVLRGSVNINKLGALQCERIKSLDKDGNFQTFSFFSPEPELELDFISFDSIKLDSIF